MSSNFVLDCRTSHSLFSLALFFFFSFSVARDRLLFIPQKVSSLQLFWYNEKAHLGPFFDLHLETKGLVRQRVALPAFLLKKKKKDLAKGRKKGITKLLLSSDQKNKKKKVLLAKRRRKVKKSVDRMKYALAKKRLGKKFFFRKKAAFGVLFHAG